MFSFFKRPDGTVHPAVKAVGHTAAWVTLAVTIVAGFEGFASKPYVDRVGTGHPITWCYGETKADGPVPPMSMTFTKQQCLDQLGQSLQKYDDMVHACIHVSLPPHREAALVSFTYNLGQGALCKGAVAAGINAGDLTGTKQHPRGCNAMLAYNHANGRVLAGLTTRRKQERALCLRDD